MKKIQIAAGLLALSLASAAQARDVLVGTDVVALGNGETNLFYQNRIFNNSAYRISGSSDGTNLGVGLGFRFYVERYADGAYLEGDATLVGSTVGTSARVGFDLRMGNIVIDPYISTGTNSVGLNIGFHL